MYPLIYHLSIDEYFPNEEFEPHLFRHLAAARRQKRRHSMVRRLRTAVLRAVGLGNGSAAAVAEPRPSACVAGEPVIRWS